jgi:hypothetical protein
MKVYVVTEKWYDHDDEQQHSSVVAVFSSKEAATVYQMLYNWKLFALDEKELDKPDALLF